MNLSETNLSGLTFFCATYHYIQNRFSNYYYYFFRCAQLLLLIRTGEGNFSKGYVPTSAGVSRQISRHKGEKGRVT